MSKNMLEFFVFVNAGDCNVHKVRSSLLRLENILKVHCLIGPTDLICYGQAQSIAELKELIDNKMAFIMKRGGYSIFQIENMIVLDSHSGKKFKRLPARPTTCAAWVFAHTGMAGYGVEVHEKLLTRFSEIKIIYRVLGRYDCLYYIEAENLSALMHVIDNGIRITRVLDSSGKPCNFLAITDTRLVLMDDKVEH